MVDVDRLAKELDEALLGRREIAPLGKTHGDFDLEMAYRIQERGIALRLARGEKIVGYKMGLTSAAKRAQMSLGLPIYGVLTDAMRVEGSLRVGDGVHPKVEPEIAFVTGRQLSGHLSRSEALRAGVEIALEVEGLGSVSLRAWWGYSRSPQAGATPVFWREVAKSWGVARTARPPPRRRIGSAVFPPQ